MEKTGWELKDFTNLILNEKKKLNDYCKSYPLSAINLPKDRFVVIRKFAAREYEGKIDMLNLSDVEASEHYPISQSGMTLVFESEFGASSSNVILPNSLNYHSVELKGETIIIKHSNGQTTTNFKEIKSLWTLEKFEEKEILNRFNSLKNFVEEPIEIKKSTKKSIEDDFFCQLKLNNKLDWYEVIKDKIEFSFVNTTVEQLNQNLKNTEKLIPILETIEDKMVEEMLALKNETWLEEGETKLSKDQFQKEIKINVVITYEDGSIEIYYNANDLFWGHEIQTSLDDKHNYKDSTLVG